MGTPFRSKSRSRCGNSTRPGIGIDFTEIKKRLAEIVPDHAMLNEVYPFNPSAENLSPASSTWNSRPISPESGPSPSGSPRMLPRPTLKIVEVFPSVQGEGLRQGEATIFVRLAGCNLRCAFLRHEIRLDRGRGPDPGLGPGRGSRDAAPLPGFLGLSDRRRAASPGHLRARPRPQERRVHGPGRNERDDRPSARRRLVHGLAEAARLRVQETVRQSGQGSEARRQPRARLSRSSGRSARNSRKRRRSSSSRNRTAARA